MLRTTRWMSMGAGHDRQRGKRGLAAPLTRGCRTKPRPPNARRRLGAVPPQDSARPAHYAAPMKIGLGVTAVIAAIAVLGLLVWGGPASDADRLEDLFNAASCDNSGTSTRETLGSKRLQPYMTLNQREYGPRFVRYVKRTDPELTVIACGAGGDVVRYFEFSSHDEALGARRAYRDGRPVCLLEIALIDRGYGHLPDYCDELDGQLM